MTSRSTRDRIVSTAGDVLGGGEYVVVAGRAWATSTSRRIPLLFRRRSLYDLVITDQRLLVLVRPRRFRAPWRRRYATPDAPVVAKRHSAFTIRHIRRYAFLYQLRLGYSDRHELVLEFYPTDRGVAREIIAQIRQAPGAPQAY